MSRPNLIAHNRTEWLKQKAIELGFISVGVSKAEELTEEAPRLERWLKEGMHGEMKYMEGHFEKRLDPRKLVPGTKSVVSLLFNYHNPEVNSKDDEFKISQYAVGTDYHFVLKRKLKELLKMMKEEWGDVEGRVFVDSAPVLERVWAAKSGLGWIGKNSLLLSKKRGSYFFTAEMMLDIEFEYDVPVADHCGSCTSCIDACPTGAIIQPYIVDGSKCISYFTIELKGAIPEPMAGKFDNWIFGCDVCQEVCPWNRHSSPTTEPEFTPTDGILEMTKSDWIDLTEEIFRDYFKSSPVMRTGFEGLKRNIKFVEQ
ncbi:MAG: tRNA epoxyqueuosine(34) reductase QueG [Euryarchaeota archaeon]|nr:tRNA epoxyqueuosine(34) reductase QueG [Euryarchaeota archaeon]|tara:strand:- start:284 stop:1222 length:939 start_codon:yes stop_codon:yes gene_type:complete